MQTRHGAYRTVRHMAGTLPNTANTGQPL